MMEQSPFAITSQDPILNELDFKPYRSFVERHVDIFVPGPNEPQMMELLMPWGEKLNVSPGDFLVSDIQDANDRWPVRADIFDQTYIITRPGFCIKRALTWLVPLVALTNGDANREVTVYSLEGPTTVLAGDFHLARGVKGEIWAFPSDKVAEIMMLVDNPLEFEDKKNWST